MAHHIAIVGGLGSGKTFLGSVLAHILKNMTNKAGHSLDLYSNYELKDSYVLEHYTDWYKIARSDVSVVVWDEAHTAFSNRKWAKYGAGIATDVMTYQRKMRAINIYCTPNLNTLDSRIRDIVEIVITCRSQPNGFYYTIYDNYTGEILNNWRLSKSVASKIFKLNLYNTFDFARPFPLPNSEKEGDRFFKKLSEIHRQKFGFYTIPKEKAEDELIDNVIKLENILGAEDNDND